MDSTSPELNLDFKLAYGPQTISGFLRDLSKIENISERLSKRDEYVRRLDEEMRKIDAFKRELPFCMLLLTDAIEALKEEAVHCATSNLRPVMEEFIPLKRNSDEEVGLKKEKDCRDKKNWMSSAQLWSSDVHSNSNINYDIKQKSVAEMKERNEEDDRSATENPFQSCKFQNGGGAFMPFKQNSGFPVTDRKGDKEIAPIPGLSLVTPGIKTPRDEPGSRGLNLKSYGNNRAVPASPTNVQSNLRTTPQQQQTSRKQRRCWSPELHRRFVNALQQLGGSQVATPKQIRELMQVDGLTNDEVKSHLQKFRLHTRRLPGAAASPANQPVVVLGGLWVSQDQYGDSSKLSTSLSGSPQGPLQLAQAAGGISTTGGDSMEDEEEGKSESYSWKGHLYKPGKDNV
ncbi:hypothetical protein HHK36_010031 [Tetracentron sinense]|uniref:HTH myb-type domain-containing protein n=1 Tax=Tetracentron sinense TaxID=13715 RepID=A0A835DIR4_TETSI|nr:hypothetical protein HHK36_010031 [Tetracentron sinense]